MRTIRRAHVTGSALAFLYLVGLATLARAASTPITTDDVADMDIAQLVEVRVSPFDVSTAFDRGYRASNSVSGSRFDCPIGELPFAIQVFTSSFIADQKPVNIFDVARYSPGVTYRSNDFNEGNANLAIRGFAVSNTKGNIQTLRDGMHGPSILDFTNIARVEIVKGPASFLYGQVAPGGIVNVITKSPQRTYSANATIRYGSYDAYRCEVDVTGPAAPSLFYRVCASYDQDIGYWKPYDAHSADFAPSLLWQPSSGFGITLRYERYLKRESPQLMQKPGLGRQRGVVPSPEDPNLSGVDFPGLADDWNGLSNFDYRNSDTHCVTSWVDLAAGNNWDFRLSYSHLRFGIDAVATGNFGMANNATSMQGRRVRFQDYYNQGNTLELQGVGQYDLGAANLRLLVGTQYIDRLFRDLAAQAANDPALGDDPTSSPLPLWDLEDPATWDYDATMPRALLTENPTDRIAKYRDRSAYGGTTLGMLGDRLLLLTGLRLTATRSQITDHVRESASAQFRSHRIAPQYGALFKMRPNIAAFASYAESFVPGSQMLRGLDGTARPAEPTTGAGFDLGIKANLLSNRISGTLTYFRVDNENVVNDLAYTEPSGSVNFYNLQSGKQRSHGIEVDATLKFGDNWQMYMSYSYMDATITEFSGHDAAILAQDPGTLDDAAQANYKNVHLLHRAPLQMSAPHLANIWTRYDVTCGPLRGLHVAGGVNLVADQAILPDSPANSRQSYTLYSLAAGLTWLVHGRQVTVDITGRNLADEHYRPSQSTRSRPREILVSASTRF